MVAAGAVLGGAVRAGTGDDQVDSFQRVVMPLLDRYCVECHMEGLGEGGVELDRFADGAEAVKDGEVWLRTLDALEGRVMPPADRPQPTEEERAALVAWIEEDYMAARCAGRTGTGPVVIRRLNRQEYDHTIRDLLGVDLDLAREFPADDSSFGFDNIGSALNISPVHVEKFLDAAERALDAAIRLPEAEDMPPIELIGLKTYPLPKDEPVEFEHTLKPGRYLVDFSLVRVGIAEAVPAPRIVVAFGSDRREIDCLRVQDETVVYRFWIDVAEGDHTVSVSLARVQPDAGGDVQQVDANVSGDQRYGSDRGLHVDSMVVHGPAPFDRATLPEAHRSLFVAEAGYGDESRAEAARKIVGRFAERAFRRPVEDDEVEELLGLFRMAQLRGESFELSVELALTTVLASPRFLFLVEPEEGAKDRPLDEFELATRLSYFLWSSMPDEELFRAARQGTLRSELREQVSRMLEDPKSTALVTNFTGQWLQLRKLAGSTPDAALFGDLDDGLRDAMREETERLFAHVLRGNRSVLELIDCDYTFVNERLARHYGMEGVVGEEFRRVPLEDRRRGGVMTQASVLTLTSNPNRTSPVKRGQWILQQLLGTPPPPPPPEVPKLDESREASDASSLRDRLEVHRTNPACATCHNQMDPLGFALEQYDAVGRWRTSDGEFPIDPSGELAGGKVFSDAEELRSLLATSYSKQFTRCLVENFLTYALGRGLVADDHCTVEEIRKRLVADGYRARTIIDQIVDSPAFQNRGGSE